MAVKFIRVKGRVIPIDEEKYSGLSASKKKRDQKVAATASDTVSKQDAVKSLRSAARDSGKQAQFVMRGIPFLAGLGTIGGFGVAATLKKSKKAAIGYGVVAGLGALGALNNLRVGLSQKKDAKQYRADANRIGKGKLLGKARHSDSARALSSVYAAGTMLPPPPMKK